MQRNPNTELITIMENLPCRLHLCWRNKLSHKYKSEDELKQVLCDCLCDWKSNLSEALIEELRERKLMDMLLYKWNNDNMAFLFYYCCALDVMIIILTIRAKIVISGDEKQSKWKNKRKK